MLSVCVNGAAQEKKKNTLWSFAWLSLRQVNHSYSSAAPSRYTQRAHMETASSFPKKNKIITYSVALGVPRLHPPPRPCLSLLLAAPIRHDSTGKVAAGQLGAWTC